jgi:hypothetical protein
MDCQEWMDGCQQVQRCPHLNMISILHYFLQQAKAGYLIP